MMSDKDLAEWKVQAYVPGFYLDGPEFLSMLARLEAAEKVCPYAEGVQERHCYPSLFRALSARLTAQGGDSVE